MSYPRDRRHRTALGYWVPLALTVTAVSIGLAAWIWSERQDSDDDDDYPDAEDVRDASERPQSKNTESHPRHHDNDAPQASDPAQSPHPETLYARMTDVISRTPSPQQLVGEAGRRIGAAFGLGNGAGRSADFRDHQRWQEEAELRAAAALVAVVDADVDEEGEDEDEAKRKEEERVTVQHAEEASRKMGAVGEVGGPTRPEAPARPPVQKGNKTTKKRTIAVVITAETKDGREEAAGMDVLRSLNVHALDNTTTDLLILIYAPHLQAYPASLLRGGEASHASADTAYDELQALALSLVPHPAHILPFTKSTSYIHLLRHLAPSLVYLQDDLAGSDSEHVAQVKGWVRQMVLVCSAEERLQELTTRSRGIEVVQTGQALERHWANAVAR